MSSPTIRPSNEDEVGGGGVDLSAQQHPNHPISTREDEPATEQARSGEPNDIVTLQHLATSMAALTFEVRQIGQKITDITNAMDEVVDDLFEQLDGLDNDHRASQMFIANQVQSVKKTIRKYGLRAERQHQNSSARLTNYLSATNPESELLPLQNVITGRFSSSLPKDLETLITMSGDMIDFALRHLGRSTLGTVLTRRVRLAIALGVPPDKVMGRA